MKRKTNHLVPIGTAIYHVSYFKSALFFTFLFCFSFFTTSAQEKVTFSTPGTGTYEIPCGITKIKIEMWGGGGAGGGSTTKGSGGTGGNAGYYSETTIDLDVVNNYEITYKVGQGGLGSTENGTNGTESTLSFNVWLGYIPPAYGGAGGYKYWATHPATNGENAQNGGSGGQAAQGNSDDTRNGGHGENPGGGGGGGYRFSEGANQDGIGGNGGNGQITLTLYTESEYCTPTITTTEPITNVSLSNLNSSSSNATTEDGLETLYCFDPVSLVSASTYEIQVQGNTGGNNTSYFAAFFDWNADGDYEDANEMFDLGTISNSTGTDNISLTSNIAIPDISPASSKMRIVKSNTPISGACNDITNGQIEEYLLRIENCNKDWKGTEDSNWNNPNNWYPTGIPTAQHCVTINWPTVFPVLNNVKAYAGSVTMQYSGQLIVQNNSSLTISGDLLCYAPILIEDSKLTCKNWHSNAFSGINSEIVIDGDLTVDKSGVNDNYFNNTILSVSGTISTAEGGIIENNCIITATDLDFNNAGGNSLLIYNSDLSFSNNVINNIGSLSMSDNSTFSCVNLTSSNSGSYLEVLKNSVLTIENTFNNETSVYIDSGSSFIQVNETDTNTFLNSTEYNFVIDRIASIERNTDYVYWSSPVKDFNVSNIGKTSHRYIWLPTVDNGGKYRSNFGNWQRSSSLMQAGKGYIVRGFLTGDEVTEIEGDFLQRQTFKNPLPNNGTIEINVFHGGYNGGTYNEDGSGSEGPSTTKISNEDDNWNLLGNPYPSALNIEKFLIENVDVVEGGVRLWTHGTAISKAADDPFYEDFVYNYTVADYLTYNATGPDIPGTFTGYLASGQGFFVAATHDDNILQHTVKFTNAMRSVAPDYTNSNFYRTTKNQKSRIWLNLTGYKTKNMVTMMVGYLEGATTGKDALFDSVIMDYNIMSLNSIVNNEPMVIQGRGLPFIASDEIPLGVIIKEKDMYSIGINQVDGLFQENNQDIYLEDLYENKIHNLKESSYNFIADPGTFNDRFILIFQAQKLDIEALNTDNTLKIFATENIIKVISKSSPIDTVTIYDALGRTLFSKHHLNVSNLELNQLKKTNSTLIVKATLVNGRTSTQKVMF